MDNRLNEYFKKNLEDLNKITDNNFSFLDDRDDVYYLKEILKAFYSNHLQAFVNAYLLLYEHKNYYVCKAIERILLSLYIKIRMLEISDNPEKVAEHFCSDGKKLKTINEQEEKFVILEEKIKLKPEDICSDTRLKSTCESGLCNYFDLLDKDSGKENNWRYKYDELSKYIHSTNASIYSHTISKEKVSSTLIEGDYIEFMDIFNNIMFSLNDLLLKVGEPKIKVLFVCLGNICRSPMAQFVFQQMVDEAGLTHLFEIDSAGTESYNEINHAGIHYGTRDILTQMHVPFVEHYSRQIRKSDYEKFDYIVAMDENNVEDIQALIGVDKDHKISLLLDYTTHPRKIKDPWYTGNFDETYWDVYEGCQGFLEYLRKEGKI